MGVEYCACETCGDTFPDSGEFVSCECGRTWCSDDCAELDGFRKEAEGYTPKGSKWAQDMSCAYCRGEDFEDCELLVVALNLLGKKRGDIIEILKAKKEAE